MAAPTGNQFWRLPSKHGRDRIFESPEIMWEAACEYFEWCQENPLMKSEAKTVNVGDYCSEIKIIEMPLTRAFLMVGLCRYLCCNEMYFNQFEESLKSKTDAISEDYSLVIKNIRSVIWEQKFSAAAAGLLKENIIAKELGIVEKKQLDHKGIPDTHITYEIAPETSDED